MLTRNGRERAWAEADALAEFQRAVTVWYAAKNLAELAEHAFSLAAEPAGTPRGGWGTARARRWYAYGDYAVMMKSRQAQEAAAEEMNRAYLKLGPDQPL